MPIIGGHAYGHVSEQMEVNLKAMVEMASYDSFDMKVCQMR